MFHCTCRVSFHIAVVTATLPIGVINSCFITGRNLSPLGMSEFYVGSAVTHIGSSLGLCNVKARLGDATSGAKDRSDLDNQELETLLNPSLLLLLLLRLLRLLRLRLFRLLLLQLTGLNQVAAVERHLRQALSCQPLKCILTVPITRLPEQVFEVIRQRRSEGPQEWPPLLLQYVEKRREDVVRQPLESNKASEQGVGPQSGIPSLP